MERRIDFSRARRMLAAALEAEVNQYVVELAGEWDEVGRRLVVRNGHHRERTVTTAAGPSENALGIRLLDQAKETYPTISKS